MTSMARVEASVGAAEGYSNEYFYKIPLDEKYYYQWTVAGTKNGVTGMNSFHDSEMESWGWKPVFAINGGFFSGTEPKGVELLAGVASFDFGNPSALPQSVKKYEGAMVLLCGGEGLGGDPKNGSLQFIQQNSDAYWLLSNRGWYRGAITGIGLLQNGVKVDWGHSSNIFPEYSEYMNRTVIGTDAQGNFLSWSWPGSKQSSPNGSIQDGDWVVKRCISLGFYNAIMLGGADSVFRKIAAKKDDNITTTQKVKNSLMLYRIKKGYNSVSGKKPSVGSRGASASVRGSSDGSIQSSMYLDGASGGAFNYIYDVIPDTGVFLYAEDGDVKATKLSNSYPAYIKAGTPGREGWSTSSKWASLVGYSDSNSGRKNWVGSSAYYGGGYKISELDGPGWVLPNCMGYAFSRAREIWIQAINNGYLYNGRITCNGNAEIVGEIGDAFLKYSVNTAAQAADAWLEAPGFYKDSSPVPGAIVCWGGGAGHVSFVEAVCNQGSDDEYAIISESHLNRSNGAKYLINFNTIYKNTGWAHPFDSSLYFKSFLVSPVSQLATYGNSSGAFGWHFEANFNFVEISEEDKEAYRRCIESMKGNKVIANLALYDKVEIQWFGKKEPDPKEGSKNVALYGLEAIVTTIDLTKPYPYGLSLSGDDKEIIGYYDRNALKYLGPFDNS